MAAVLIAIGAILLALAGCATPEPRRSGASDDPEEADRLMEDIARSFF